MKKKIKKTASGAALRAAGRARLAQAKFAGRAKRPIFTLILLMLTLRVANSAGFSV
jgi:hypothetical protein